MSVWSQNNCYNTSNMVLLSYGFYTDISDANAFEYLCGVKSMIKAVASSVFSFSFYSIGNRVYRYMNVAFLAIRITT